MFLITRSSPIAHLSLACALAIFAPACGGAQTLGDVAAQHLDDHADDASGWDDVLEEMPADLGAATAELTETAAALVKEMTDLPAPGHVELKDLSADLARFQGKAGADFLAAAKREAGKASAFEYVVLGVPELDEFFKNAEETYALAYQATQALANLKRISSKALGAKVEAGPELQSQVAKALLLHEPPAVAAELRALDEMSRTLARLVPEIGARAAKLVASGQALVAAAPATITNPKVLAHLGTVQQGVTRSLHVVKSSATLLEGLTKDLASFKS